MLLGIFIVKEKAWKVGKIGTFGAVRSTLVGIGLHPFVFRH